ncbi:SMI1/KNR4 family protein [Chondrinema litorale]|uniref:SMI1/KNR4 family protein n=1 Tax=Chondrinema litorale TaxID=2994555 RepID=UPI00254398C2|nr:SMI1/KNR4 family protein [Chondrinema litorale]UZR93826.1 SMI1/KNR4 family protein [Chondrinema litorale]
MKQTSHTGFWDNSDYALKNYVCEPLTMELLMSVEDELGYKLPQFYIEMMKNQNGGLPVNTCFPTESSNSWAGDHVAITGIFGIGRDKPYSLCGNGGSQFMIEEWGYPEIGICICDCPSAGHDMIMLDYRKCGKDGEPQVVHVDQEGDYRITFVAETFEEFVRGLVNWEVFDTSEADLKNKLHAIETGRYSDRLQDLLTKEGAFGEQMSNQLRKLLIELTTQKGYFALHADALSYLVYDVQFYLFAKHQIVKTGEQ